MRQGNLVIVSFLDFLPKLTVENPLYESATNGKE